MRCKNGSSYDPLKLVKILHKIHSVITENNANYILGYFKRDMVSSSKGVIILLYAAIRETASSTLSSVLPSLLSLSPVQRKKVQKLESPELLIWLGSDLCRDVEGLFGRWSRAKRWLKRHLQITNNYLKSTFKEDRGKLFRSMADDRLKLQTAAWEVQQWIVMTDCFSAHLFWGK